MPSADSSSKIHSATRPEDLPPALPAPPLEPSDKCHDKPLSYVDVFVDDFLAVAQGDLPRLKLLRRILLHAVDDILKSPLDHPKAREPISLKKLAADGTWTSGKKILGWWLDAHSQTLRLPADRIQRIAHS